MTEQLKPCPFCGAEDIGFDSWFYNQNIFCKCKICGCQACATPTKKQAIKAWNTRLGDNR